MRNGYKIDPKFRSSSQLILLPLDESQPTMQRGPAASTG